MRRLKTTAIVGLMHQGSGVRISEIAVTALSTSQVDNRNF